MLPAGVAVGLGTDGEKENDLDLFEETKVASLRKLSSGDATAMDSWTHGLMDSWTPGRCGGWPRRAGRGRCGSTVTWGPSRPGSRPT